MGLGEGTLILSDIRRLGPFLGVQILIFCGRGVQKELFLNLSLDTELAYFLGAANFQLFWGMSDTSDTFFWSGGMLGPSLCSKKKESTPTPLPGGIRRLHHFLVSFKADSHTTVHGFVFLL